MSKWESRTVPSEPFREKFRYLQKYHGLTERELAQQIGYDQNGNQGSAIRHVLGLGDNPDKRIRIVVAEKLMRALHLDPFECGL